MTSTPQINQRMACRATAQALRPAAVRTIARNVPAGAGDDGRAGVEEMLLQAMRTDSLLERTGPWWSASGPGLTAALVHVTGVGQTSASYLLGAAMHAQILAGADLLQDVVLRLAERAACWHAGSRWVLDDVQATLARHDV